MVYNNVCLDDPQALQIVIVSDVNDEELFQNTTSIFQQETSWLRIPYDDTLRKEFKKTFEVKFNPQVLLFNGLNEQLIDANINENLNSNYLLE